MKKILYMILLAGVVLSSCTRTITIMREPVEDRLVILALMHTSDTLHDVAVKVSGEKGLTDPDESAVVRCTVNGEAVPVIPGWSSYEFTVDATFKPGDEVMVDAEYDGMYAFSKVVVPEAVEAELADTFHQVEYGTDWVTKTIFAKLRIKDISGDKTYFRIGDMRHQRHELYPDKVRDVWHIQSRYFDLGNDPILHDDYIMTNEDDMLSVLNPTNYFRVFSDRLFEDSVAEVQLSFVEDLFQHYDYHERPYESYSILNVVIEHISSEAYYYYKALNSGKMTGFESYGGLIMEPVVIPTNVTGGLGYVNVSMDTNIPIILYHHMLDDEGNVVEVDKY